MTADGPLDRKRLEVDGLELGKDNPVIRVCIFSWVLPRAIERMIGINGQAVEADVTAVAALLDLPLRRLVARFASRLQLTSAERGIRSNLSR